MLNIHFSHDPLSKIEEGIIRKYEILLNDKWSTTKSRFHARFDRLVLRLFYNENCLIILISLIWVSIKAYLENWCAYPSIKISCMKHEIKPKYRKSFFVSIQFSLIFFLTIIEKWKMRKNEKLMLSIYTV